MRSFCVSISLALGAALIAAAAHAQEPVVPSAPPTSDLPGTVRPAAAAPSPRSAAVDTSIDPAERLNTLFSELKRERNERAAMRIAGRISEALGSSGSASVDLMMQWAQKAATERKFDIALDFLDQVTAMRPDFAEGWNRRATVHFMMNNYRKSMADIERTLELEPRHFGALSGIARIMQATDRPKLALDAYERVLAVYPMMRDAQNAVGDLADELAGDPI